MTIREISILINQLDSRGKTRLKEKVNQELAANRLLNKPVKGYLLFYTLALLEGRIPKLEPSRMGGRNGRVKIIKEAV